MTMLCTVVLLSIPAVLRACSTLPPGQEARVGFLVEELNSLPKQFATTSTTTAGFAASSDEAIKNIRKVVKKAIMKVIKEEAKKAGVEHLAADVASQIKPTVRYTPLNCATVTGNPPDCKISGDFITQVKNAEIPANYRGFMVNLLISNYVIGGWGRERWQLTLMKVEKQLRTDKTYGPCFKTASITLLYP